MKTRWGVVGGCAAVVQLLFLQGAQVAHADTFLAQATWPPPLQPPMQAQPVAGPRVMLRVDNPNGRLQQFTPLRWRDVCIAPCGVTVDPAGTYRVGGGTSMASDAFTLPRASGDVWIDAQVGSKVKHWVGLGMMIGGVVAAGYGLLWWQLFSGVDDTTAGGSDVRDVGRNVGVFFIGVGAVLEIVGLIMFGSGTSVQVK
jgi:hypothetical protein